MPRTKSFDRDTALDAAAAVFALHGYEGTSTDALLAAMKIGRQSLYDTFGDKRQLYLESLERYNTGSTADIIKALHTGTTPLDGIEAALLRAAALKPDEGCLGVSAICEFGRSDREVSRATDAASQLLQKAFEQRFAEAKTAGLVDRTISTAEAATFLAAILSGMKVSARGGASPKDLRAIARRALRAFAPT
ncbi:MAG TPA: TetR/AcrR family transcriptional regulator [Kofleriaceae bacterium]